ncbi:MAG: hypothetical protein Q4D41_10060 [Prevotellaceae bacterium]|nr:hypothetical protein [Prevotellaceae bacterium]
MEKELKKQGQTTETLTEKTTGCDVKEPKKTNKTWEAFGKSKGCFIINDPKFLL